MPPITRSIQIRPGAHFLIRGFASIDGKEWVPVEIDLGERIDMAGHAVCTAVIKQAISKSVARAVQTGHWKVLEGGAPEREGAPPIIGNGSGG